MSSDDSFGDETEDSLRMEFPLGLRPTGVSSGAGAASEATTRAPQGDSDLPPVPWTSQFAAQEDARRESSSGQPRADVSSPQAPRDPQARQISDAQMAPRADQGQPAAHGQPSAPGQQSGLARHFQVGGRNLVLATAVGVVLVGFVLATIIWVPWVFVAFVALFLTVGVVELNSALLASTAKPIGWIVAAFTPLIIIATYLAGIHLTWENPLPVSVSPFSVVIGASAVVMLLCCAWRLLGPTDGYVRDVATAIFVLVYLPVLGSSIVLLLLSAHPVAAVLMCLLCPIANDTGAYALGVATARTTDGNHKMAPRISPAKSWEGFGGGLLAGVIAGAIFGHFALDYSWLLGAVCGLALSLVAVLGDLIESIMKRDAGLKDFGHIIPGHGGAMDRIDSIIFAAPVFYLFAGLVG